MKGMMQSKANPMAEALAKRKEKGMDLSILLNGDEVAAVDLEEMNAKRSAESGLAPVLPGSGEPEEKEGPELEVEMKMPSITEGMSDNDKAMMIKSEPKTLGGMARKKALMGMPK